MSKVNWNGIIDGIAAGMLVLSLLVLTTGTLALLLFDSIVGTGSIYKLSEFLQGNNRLFVSIFGSMSSTGLQTALAFTGYLLYRRGFGALGWAMFGAGLIFWGIDVYFDALTADIVRYGDFVALQSLSGVEKTTHALWRTVVGGFSAVGEFLAFAILAGMSELKAFIRSTLNNFEKYTPPQQPKKQQPYHVPPTIPRRQQAPASQPVQKPAHADEMAQEFNEFMDSVAEEPTYHPQNYRA